MEKIASFQVNHLFLKKGIYVSRIDSKNGCFCTTFDLRMREPNNEPVIDVPALHTIEHLAATYLRNSNYKEDIVYFGPMGCRTGCYLIMFGKLSSKDIYQLILDLCEFIINFEGKIPGASAIECGNYQEQNLDMAKYYIKEYKNYLLSNPCFEYPKL